MATFKIAYDCLCFVEFDNDPKQALEYAYGENFMTYKGINRRDEPHFQGWSIVDSYLSIYPNDIASASLACSIDVELENLVLAYYRTNYWSIFKGDSINDQHSANRILCMSALCGVVVGIRLSQVSLGCNPDGTFGNTTLGALNRSKSFNQDYDLVCSLFLRSKCENFISYMPNLDGWLNRITKVANYV